MRVNFFEEFPTAENMRKLDLVDWPSTLFVAAHSFAEFENIRKTYGKPYPHIVFGWWPLIRGAYWISGFTDSKRLKGLFAEAGTSHTQPLPLLLDLELPRDLRAWFGNLPHVSGNKKLIWRFIEHASELNIHIYTAEHPVTADFFLFLELAVGITFPFSGNHVRIPMVYTSLGWTAIRKRMWNSIMRFEAALINKDPEMTMPALGTIAQGIWKNEPILPPEQLGKDLSWAKEVGAEEVFIFRLGGLTERYTAVIKPFLA
ncbi:MAG: hypothetical protein JO026_01365 [Patescibacteria group bacterium]|nr:hypothetical protein [Patescibacteria group bacterium]